MNRGRQPVPRRVQGPAGLAQEIVALAAYHLALGLPRLLSESRPLALDPAEFADHRQPHGLIAHRPRRGPSTAFCFLTPDS
jgi:hypothetical protein